jgi:hypothetical protein
MGLSETPISSPERRDRLLLVSAIAIAPRMFGAAGEAIGIDKYLKTNTVKRRTLSLLNQGLFHHAALWSGSPTEPSSSRVARLRTGRYVQPIDGERHGGGTALACGHSGRRRARSA